MNMSWGMGGKCSPRVSTEFPAPPHSRLPVKTLTVTYLPLSERCDAAQPSRD